MRFLSSVLSSSVLRLVENSAEGAKESGVVELLFRAALEEILQRLPPKREKSWSSVFVDQIQAELEQLPLPRAVVREIDVFVRCHFL
jgi:hypothetical protein